MFMFKNFLAEEFKSIANYRVIEKACA